MGYVTLVFDDDDSAAHIFTFPPCCVGLTDFQASNPYNSGGDQSYTSDHSNADKGVDKSLPGSDDGGCCLRIEYW